MQRSRPRYILRNKAKWAGRQLTLLICVLAISDSMSLIFLRQSGGCREQLRAYTALRTPDGCLFVPGSDIMLV